MKLPLPLHALRGLALAVGDEVDMTVLREELLERPQAVAQLMVVAKPALHIAVARHGGAGIAAELLQGRLAFSTPGVIVPVNP